VGSRRISSTAATTAVASAIHSGKKTKDHKVMKVLLSRFKNRKRNAMMSASWHALAAMTT
jgi:hypothetical protein